MEHTTEKSHVIAEELLGAIEPVRSRSLFERVKNHEAGFENARFGWMAILLTLQSCVGAVACMLISQDGSPVFSLALCAAITMGSNALFIALASPRLCLAGFYLSMAVNTVLILMHL